MHDQCSRGGVSTMEFITCPLFTVQNKITSCIYVTHSPPPYACLHTYHTHISRITDVDFKQKPTPDLFFLDFCTA